MTTEMMSGGGVRTGTPDTDRRIDDAESGGPPTAHNMGWYQYEPTQRYVAYLGAYYAFAEAAASGQLDIYPDTGIWMLSHAAADKEALQAGMAALRAEPDSDELDAVKQFHNTVYGVGTFYEGQDHPYADLNLPRINVDDPEGTIERFIVADVQATGPGSDPAVYMDSQVDKAILWGVGLFERMGNVVSEGIEAFGGPEAVPSTEAGERVTGDNTINDLFRRVGDETFGPEEEAAATRRNVQNTATGIAATAAAGYATPGLAAGVSSGMLRTQKVIPGGIGASRARVADDRILAQQAMSSRWTGEMMAVAPRSTLSPIAQTMKAVVPNNVRMQAVRMMNNLANANQWTQSTTSPWMAPVRVASRWSPRVKAAAASVPTLGVGVGKSIYDARVGSESETIDQLLQGLPEGDTKDYILNLLQQQQTQGGE